jgi:hypothetical protein
MQRNMDVAQASVARFPFRVVNSLDHAATIQLLVESDPPGWQVRFLEGCEPVLPVFEMDPYRDCPRDLIVELIPPPGARPGEEGRVIVRAITEEGEDVGGATLIGRVSQVERHTFTVLEALYDTLFEMDPDGRVIPGLAQWWEISDDGMYVLVRLRDGVLLHNGEMLNAEIVAASLLEPVELLPEVWREPLYVNSLVEWIGVVDDRTLEFYLTAPLPGELLVSLALPENAIAFPYEPFVGTGPFRFEGMVPGVETVLGRFDEHWKGPVPLERLVYLVVLEEAARVVGLISGEFDAIVGVEPELFDLLAASGDVWLDGIPCDYRAVARWSVDEFEFHPDNVLRLWDAGWLGTETLLIAIPEMP